MDDWYQSAQQKGAKERSRKRTRRALIRLLIKLAVVIGGTWAVLTWLFGVYVVHSNDMFPAVRDGDLCITNRRASFLSDEIISYTHEGRRYFGRIVGVAGDEISMDGEGHFTVNGNAPFETVYYVTSAAEDSPVRYPCFVGEGCVFVLNDMREQTADSRSFGPIPLEEADGSVVLLLRRRGW